MARIVLIDDDPIIAELIRRTLAPIGHEVLWLEDGENAIAEIWDHNADLVLLDCALPGKAGMTVLGEIRQTLGLERLPIMMLTSRRSQTYESLALTEGANDYLRKPFELADLVTRVAQLAHAG